MSSVRLLVVLACLCSSTSETSSDSHLPGSSQQEKLSSGQCSADHCASEPDVEEDGTSRDFSAKSRIISEDNIAAFASLDELIPPVEWPEGQYGFPECNSSCPLGFDRGCRYHDTEDSSSVNRFTNQDHLSGLFARDIEICYCIKQSNEGTSPWPPGRYCINRVGGVCPKGFGSEELYWDDEDTNNKNTASGTLPDGEYNKDTRMYYCCRNDGDASTPILLPVDHPFILYQYGQRGCQQVLGMDAVEVVILWDDENSNNENFCDGGPFNVGCNSANHHLMFCSYVLS